MWSPGWLQVGIKDGRWRAGADYNRDNKSGYGERERDRIATVELCETDIAKI
jgi:hypothetical protein